MDLLDMPNAVAKLRTLRIRHRVEYLERQALLSTPQIVAHRRAIPLIVFFSQVT